MSEELKVSDNGDQLNSSALEYNPAEYTWEERLDSASLLALAIIFIMPMLIKMQVDSADINESLFSAEALAVGGMFALLRAYTIAINKLKNAGNKN